MYTLTNGRYQTKEILMLRTDEVWDITSKEGR
jgi:hypothetical protein